MMLHIFSPSKRETVLHKKVKKYFGPASKLLNVWYFPHFYQLFYCIIIFIYSETKKRSNFLCSIICCLGKKSSKYKGGKKGRDSFSVGKGNGGSGASGSGDLCLDSKQNSQSKSTKQLLPEIRADDVGKKCIVIDLDETLVHSSFKVIYGK